MPEARVLKLRRHINAIVDFYTRRAAAGSDQLHLSASHLFRLLHPMWPGPLIEVSVTLVHVAFAFTPERYFHD